MNCTADIERRIVSFVRSGGFVWVACEAAGVPFKEFRTWMTEGSLSEDSVHRSLYLAVLQARAEARLGAEVTIRGKNPGVWLRHGPGRHPQGRAGWGAKPPSRRSTSSQHLSLEWNRLIEQTKVSLDPFPEAKQTLVAVLARLDKDSSPQRHRGTETPG